MKPISGTDPDSLEREARRIIRLLVDAFRLPDGGFAVDKVGDRLMPQHTFHDLGDFLPFLFYFGERDLAASQVALYKRAAPGGVLVSEYPTARVLYGLAKSYEYTDLLLGLLAFDAVVRTQESEEMLRTTADAAIRIFSLDGWPKSFYLAHMGLCLPVLDTRISTLIECFLEMRHLPGGERYMAVARNLFRTLVDIPFYKTHEIFPDFVPLGALSVLPLPGNGWRSGAMHKSTTNTLFAFLEMYRATGDAHVMRSIRATVGAVRGKMMGREGAIAERFDPRSTDLRPHLGASFSMLDFLCDLWVVCKQEEDLAFARSIADYWLSEQAESGLFPLKGGGEASFIDSETDMIVALHKLYEITGDETYIRGAERCLAGILAYHGSHDYPLSMHIRTGKVIDTTQRTKFLCLFLKSIILRLEYAKGARIYTSPSLFELLKDR